MFGKKIQQWCKLGALISLLFAASANADAMIYNVVSHQGGLLSSMPGLDSGHAYLHSWQARHKRVPAQSLRQNDNGLRRSGYGRQRFGNAGFKLVRRGCRKRGKVIYQIQRSTRGRVVNIRRVKRGYWVKVQKKGRVKTIFVRC